MKFYIGISGGKVLGNWGGDTELSREEACLLCGLDKADALEVREIQTGRCCGRRADFGTRTGVDCPKCHSHKPVARETISTWDQIIA